MFCNSVLEFSHRETKSRFSSALFLYPKRRLLFKDAFCSRKAWIRAASLRNELLDLNLFLGHTRSIRISVLLGREILTRSVLVFSGIIFYNYLYTSIIHNKTKKIKVSWSARLKLIEKRMLTVKLTGLCGARRNTIPSKARCYVLNGSSMKI